MASKTPSALYIENMGSLTAHIAVMSTAASGDWWASSITNIVGVFSEQLGVPSSATTTGAQASFTATNGTIWLYCGTASAGVRLLVLSGAGY